jgi:ferrous iron transport protein B
LFLVFQAVFAWAQVPMDAIKDGVDHLGGWLGHTLPPSLLKDLFVNGVLAGVGSVLVFLPQIMILFFFILLLEDSGYLPRAAFLLDRIMGSVGLSGRAFIPLLSSFACAIPGIMATRTIQNPRDRLSTIMIAPLMTCSARLPVYALIIGAFIPAHGMGRLGTAGHRAVRALYRGHRQRHGRGVHFAQAPRPGHANAFAHAGAAQPITGPTCATSPSACGSGLKFS